jgi:DNA-binding protein Alba
MTTVADVAETIRRKSMQELDVRKITIGTEETPQQENGTRNVSTIKTTLKRE